MTQPVKVFRMELTQEEMYCLRHLLAEGPGEQTLRILAKENVDAEEVLNAVRNRVQRSLFRGAGTDVPAVTKEDLERAVPWQVFRGPAVTRIADVQWDLFSGFRIWDEVAEAVAAKLGLKIVRDAAGEAQNPCKEDEHHHGDDEVSDYDACLAYLRSGGTLMFCPDDEEQVRKHADGKENVYGRFVVVEEA